MHEGAVSRRHTTGDRNREICVGRDPRDSARNGERGAGQCTPADLGTESLHHGSDIVSGIGKWVRDGIHHDETGLGERRGHSWAADRQNCRATWGLGCDELGAGLS